MPTVAYPNMGKGAWQTALRDPADGRYPNMGSAFSNDADALAEFAAGSGQARNNSAHTVFDAVTVDDARWLDLPGATGAYASVPDHADLDITGDIDLRVAVALDDWTPPTSVGERLISKYASATTQDSYMLRVDDATGELRLVWYDGSSDNSGASTVAPTVKDGELLLVRSTLDVDNGAGGYDVEFFTKSSTPENAAADLSADTGWTQLGATVTGGSTTSVNASTSPVEFGRADNDTQMLRGRIFAAIIKDGIDGTTVLDVDFTSQTAGATSFTDGTGSHTVTVNGTAKIAPLGVSFLDLDGAAGSRAQSAHQASHSFSTAMEWVVKYQHRSSVAQVLGSKRRSASSDRSWILVENSAGIPSITVSETGSTELGFSASTPLPAQDGDTVWVKFTIEPDYDGAGNGRARFYTSSNGIGWTQLGTDVTGALTSINSSNSLSWLYLGTYGNDLGLSAFRLFSFKWLNGIGGTTIVDIDFEDLAAGTTSFTDETSTHTINVVGTAAVVGPDAIRAWDSSAATARVALQATAANRPLWVARAVNGQPALRFDGSNDSLSYTQAAIGDATYIGVAALDSGGVGSTRNLMDGTGRRIYGAGSSNWRAYDGTASVSGGTVDANWHVFVARFGTTDYLYVDGGAEVASGDGGSANPTNIKIGTDHGATSQFWDGDIHYLAVYDGDLHADNLPLLNRVCRALANRVGTTWSDILTDDQALAQFTSDDAHTAFDASAITGLSDTDPVATWEDASGNGHDATAAGAARPTYIASAVNSQPALRFNGTAQTMATAAFTALTQPNTVIAVAKYDDADTNARHIFDGIDATRRHIIYSGSGGTWQAYAGSSIGSTTDDSAWHVFVSVFDGASSNLYLDGGAANASGDTGSQTLAGLRVGSRYAGASNFWDGDIHYLAVYDGDLYADNLPLLNQVCRALASRVDTTWTDIT